jgi:nucleotide-binding universal stress UspA family protein
VATVEATKAFLKATAQPARPDPAAAAATDPGRTDEDPAPTPQPPAGVKTMSRVLVPVSGSRNDRFAVQAVIQRFMNNTAMEVHLLNVQTPFPADIAHFTSRKDRQDVHRERAEEALAPAREMLDRLSVPYSVHTETGDKARLITEAARRLHCDEIVMATARKNSLTRLIESSVTDRVLELTDVPVEVIAGDTASRWERYGIPAAVVAALAFALAD